MPEASSSNTLVELKHLSPDFIKNLDILFGQLLALNGGFGKWTFEIKDGDFVRFLNEQSLQPKKLKLL